MDTTGKKRAWSLDQLAKSEFFHQKLHDWRLLEVIDAIESLKGETFVWGRAELGISEKAWDKVIHRGIKPVLVFAHPQTLMSVPRSVGYYRMLAMVSQKSMGQVGLPTKRFEDGVLPNETAALALASHLNKIVSVLIEADDTVDGREFDLWRGMAAGSQAQGSWQNAKGRQMELIIRGMVRLRLREANLLSGSDDDATRIELADGRAVVFGSEPDIAFYEGEHVAAALEIKGGIDKAGVLERVGAALKSLRRAKNENPAAKTILVLAEASLTPQALHDLELNQQIIDHWFTAEAVLEDEGQRNDLFRLLAL